MKRLMILSLFSIMAIASSLACNITITTSGEKQAYKVGEEVLINVQVKLIHHNCERAIKDTKFTYEGLKIISATEWKEVSPGTFTRQVKAQIIESSKAEAKLTAQRTCDRDGGRCSVTIKKTT